VNPSPAVAGAPRVHRLEALGLQKSYGVRKVVKDVRLAVDSGEVVGLLGPNGAGKTTTVEILEGLNQPDAGEVEILGTRWGAGDDRALRERIGPVVLFEDLQGALAGRIAQNHRIRLQLHRDVRDAELTDSLLEVQRQRLAHHGKILVVDGHRSLRLHETNG